MTAFSRIIIKVTLLAIILVFFSCSSIFTYSYVNSDRRQDVILLAKDNTFESDYWQYTTSLGTIGLDVKVAYPASLKKINLSNVKILIIPGDTAASLDEKSRNIVIDEVKKGLCLITEQKTALAQDLGLRYLDGSTAVDTVLDRKHPDIEIKWAEKINIDNIESSGLEVFSNDKSTGLPVLVGGQLDKGRFLYMGAPFDKRWMWGYGRFTFFHEALIEYFEYKPVQKKNSLAAYMDWGFHFAEDPVLLAGKYKEYGISEIHLSSWYSMKNCGAFFQKFIDACHANGILVYSWFELPMVTQEFWDLHPEWREKTATGRDAKIDWRSLMAFENPDCMKAVKTEMKNIIDSYDWDGVDFAELYFESPDGFKSADNLTPMSDYVRADFKKRYGIDPIEIFNKDSRHFYERNQEILNKFIDYRIELCTELNRELLEFIKAENNNARKRKLDVVLTQIDSVIDERMRPYIGVDADSFMKLQDEYGFTFQVEDPFTLWGLGPDRYKKIGEAYKAKMKTGAILTVDINIVNRLDTKYPNSKQTGLEFLVLLSEASKYSDQVCIYSVGTTHAHDFKYASNALASRAKVKKITGNQYVTKSPYTFVLEADSRGMEVFINGTAWPCASTDSIIVPSGDNLIEIKPYDKGFDDLRITGTNTEIFECVKKGKGILLKYNEKRNVVIDLDKKPEAVRINGENAVIPIVFNGKEYVASCPSGENEIEFIADLR